MGCRTHRQKKPPVAWVAFPRDSQNYYSCWRFCLAPEIRDFFLMLSLNPKIRDGRFSNWKCLPRWRADLVVAVASLMIRFAQCPQVNFSWSNYGWISAHFCTFCCLVDGYCNCIIIFVYNLSLRIVVELFTTRTRCADTATAIIANQLEVSDKGTPDFHGEFFYIRDIVMNGGGQSPKDVLLCGHCSWWWGI